MLVFSYIGFISQKLNIEGKTSIDVTLKEEITKLDEAVVKAEKMHREGGFAIPQREISTSVQTVNFETIEGVQVTSVDDALQGRVAGLDIIASSGDPGSGASMRIRGTTSINASSEPLIVLNGVPYQVEIDPNFDFATANQEQYANMLSIIQMILKKSLF
jgi:outer membrane cobalamin receptor